VLPVFGLEFGCAEGATEDLLSFVDGRITACADIERVELVIVQLVFVNWILITSLSIERFF